MNARPGADWRMLIIRHRLLLILLTFLVSRSTLLAQCTLVCNSGVQVSLPATGQYLLTTSLFAPSAPALCPGTLNLAVYEGPGQPLSGNIATCDQVGQTMYVRVTHAASGNYCESEVTINDLLNPSLACPTRFISCAADPDPAVMGIPGISDNCTPFYLLDIDWFDQTTTLPCGTLQNGIPVRERINRVWQVSDLSGNQSTCLEQIYLKAPSLDSVIFPVNLDDFAAPSLSCGDDPENLVLTGQPLLFGHPIENSGPCEMGVTHADQIINGCSTGSYTILRTWTTVDFCTSQIKQRIQVIKIRDKLPPVLTAPTATTVSTTETTCSGTVTLPLANATDLCSAVSIVPQWQFGTGYGPFNNVPEGTHWVTYTATDACGNTAIATTSITVADQIPPQVICVTALQISLGTNGEAYANAAALDAGSWDNCGAVFRSVSRDEVNWANTVTLTCADKNIPVLVTLRVQDGSGLFNYCEVMITARDFLKPVITCPANLTINCLQDNADLNITGQPVVSDNCGLSTITFNDINDLSACHTGTVQRQWKAEDSAGNTKTCVQNITITLLPPPSVTFPPDRTLNGCNNALDLTPSATGNPLIAGATCFPLSVTYTDDFFDIAAPACFVVFRKWKITDQCTYNPNNGNAAIWEHVQKINVTDMSPPELIVPADITVTSGNADCNAWVDLPAAIATDCSPVLTISNNSASGSQGAQLSGWFSPGIHHIVYTASDGCGNQVQKSVTVTVTDLIPPAAVCLNGLAVNLTPGGWVTLDPQLFDGGSTDNCSGQGGLTFSIAPAGFSCQHVGQQAVTLSVTDVAGNTASCQTYVNVQDNQNVCPRHFVEGYISTPEGDPVPGIQVSNGQGDTVVTDSAGLYRFTNLLPGKNYTIKPWNNSNWLNGVTAYDFVLISRHILNLEPISTPERIIAADINISGTVTTFDIVQMRKVLLGTVDSVPGGKSWRFIPADFTFIEPLNPFLPAFPEVIAITGLDANFTNQNFKAIKTGDIDLSADPTATFSSVFQSYQKMILRVLGNLQNE